MAGILVLKWLRGTPERLYLCSVRLAIAGYTHQPLQAGSANREDGLVRRNVKNVDDDGNVINSVDDNDSIVLVARAEHSFGVPTNPGLHQTRPHPGQALHRSGRGSSETSVDYRDCPAAGCSGLVEICRLKLFLYRTVLQI